MHCKASGFGKGKRYYTREGFWPAKTVNYILSRNEKGSYILSTIFFNLDYCYDMIWSRTYIQVI